MSNMRPRTSLLQMLSNTAGSGPPFPTRQLFVLALCRICEPIAFMSIFPYIYYMVKSFEITNNERQIALYAGMVTSAFAMCEFAASIFWGRLSDRVGRKPILLTGLAGTGVSMVIFGFARSLPVALFARAVGGILNGNIGVLQTTVAEVVTNEAHQPRAFSIMPFTWCLGSIVGAALGGTLAEPVKNYPSLFSSTGIFAKYPYLLPNLVCTGVVVVGLLIGILFLEESHEDKKDNRDSGREIGQWLLSALRRQQTSEKPADSGRYTPLRSTESEKIVISPASSPRLSSVSTSVSEVDVYIPKSGFTNPPSTLTWRQTFSNQILLCILALGVLAFHTIAFEQLLPVLFSMPESNTAPQLPFKFVGGFALTTKTIGVILTIQGVMQMIVQIIVFPWVTTRLGPLWTFRIVVFGYPFLYFIVPYLSLVPIDFRYPAILFVLMCKVTAQALSYPSLALMLNGTAPKKVLGTLNGFSMSAASFARTIGPLAAGSLQATGLRTGYSGISWWFCALVAIFGAVISCYQRFTKKEPISSLDVLDISNEENLLAGSIDESTDDTQSVQSNCTLIEQLLDLDEEEYQPHRIISRL